MQTWAYLNVYPGFDRRVSDGKPAPICRKLATYTVPLGSLTSTRALIGMSRLDFGRSKRYHEA